MKINIRFMDLIPYIVGFVTIFTFAVLAEISIKTHFPYATNIQQLIISRGFRIIGMILMAIGIFLYFAIQSWLEKTNAAAKNKTTPREISDKAIRR